MNESTIRVNLVPGGFISVSFNHIEVSKFLWPAWTTCDNGILDDIDAIVGKQYRYEIKARIDRCIAGI